MLGVKRPNRSVGRGMVVTGALLVAACTGERPELAAEPEATTTSTVATTTTEVERGTEVAEAAGEAIDVFAEEESDEPAQQLTAAAVTSAPGIPVVFLVKDRGDERIEVYLPSEPAGSTGWVRAADVTLSRITHRIEIDLDGHRIRVLDDGDVVVDEPAGIGPDRPDPNEGIYLRELVQPPEDDSPYGAYAYGLSGAPMVRTGLEAGEGVVGIHGTDEPDRVGTDMPSGSIALAADVLARLVDDLGLPLGTPVEIIP